MQDIMMNLYDWNRGWLKWLSFFCGEHLSLPNKHVCFVMRESKPYKLWVTRIGFNVLNISWLVILGFYEILKNLHCSVCLSETRWPLHWCMLEEFTAKQKAKTFKSNISYFIQVIVIMALEISHFLFNSMVKETHVKIEPK